MDPADKTLPCIRCGRKLHSSFPGTSLTEPSDGVVFTAYGNYGSQVWDPMDDPIGVHPTKSLKINICDDCLVAAAANGQVYHSKTVYVAAPEPILTLWVPGDKT